MYHIRKKIHEVFGDFTKPSFGALKPALNKLEKLNYIKSRKTLSQGGKLTGAYSITSEGKKALKTLLMEDLSKNPIQIKNNASIKIIASEILPDDIQKSLLSSIHKQLDLLKVQTERKLQKSPNLSTYQKLLIDNLILEYTNYMKLIERIVK